MSNKFTDAMLLLAAEVSRDPLWLPLAEYYESRERGLRDSAHQAAGRFAESARRWSFEERKRFSLWLMDRTGRVGELCGQSKFKSRYSTGGSGLFAPFVVVEAVVRPTLAEWVQKEPENPEPRFWLALYDKSPWEHVGDALRLDPAYSPACGVKIELILAAVEYDQHELPSGYLDDPVKDLNYLCEAETLAVHVDDPQVQASMRQRIALFRTAAEDWIKLRDKLKGLDWAARSSIWRERGQ